MADDAAEVATKTVQLPCGLGPDKDGKIHRDAEIASMTGMVRKNIARPEVRQNGSKVIDAILLACLRRVGPISKIDRRLLDKMLNGDREFLLLEIRKASLTSKVHATITCGSCNQKVDITYSLDGIPVTTLPDSDKETVNGERTFLVDWMSADERHSVKARFRYPNGADQMDVAQMMGRNPVEANYRMYYRCLIEWDGKPVDQILPNIFEVQPLPVLDAVDREFRNSMPGPQLDQEVTCPLCGADNDLDLRASDFLFPLARGKGQTE